MLAKAVADFQPWYLPSTAIQLLWVTGFPSAISQKDHFKDTKLEKERVCLLCVSLKPLYAYLLAITLFIITTTWNQGRNLEVKKHWNIEVRIWAGKKQIKDREIKTSGGIQITDLMGAARFLSIFIHVSYLPHIFPYWSCLHIVRVLERPLFSHCNTKFLKRNILKLRS